LISSLCPGGRRGPAGWGRGLAGSAAARAPRALAPPDLPPSPALEINFLALPFLLLWCLCMVTPPRDGGLPPLPLLARLPLAMFLSQVLGGLIPPRRGVCVPPQPGDGWGALLPPAP